LLYCANVDHEYPGTTVNVLAREVLSLRRWEAEATIVIKQWEGVWESVGRPGALGRSKAESLGEYVADLRDNVVVDLQEELGMANAYIADMRKLIADLRTLLANATNTRSMVLREQLLDEMRYRLTNYKDG